MRRVFITLTMFLNNAMRFYHFGDVFKQSITLDGCRLDDRLFVWTIVCSFGRSFVHLGDRLFVVWVCLSFRFVRRLGDVLKQCDAFLSLWRCFEIMRLLSITLVNRPFICFCFLDDLLENTFSSGEIGVNTFIGGWNVTPSQLPIYKYIR